MGPCSWLGRERFSRVSRLSSDGPGGMYVAGVLVALASLIEAFDSEVYWNPSSFILAPANGAPGSTLNLPIPRFAAM